MPYRPDWLELVGRGEIGGQFLGGDVVQHDLQRRAGLDAAHQELDAAPQRLGGLEIRVVQHAAHGGRQRLVDARDELLLAGVAGRLRRTGRRGGASAPRRRRRPRRCRRPVRRAKSDSLRSVAMAAPRAWRGGGGSGSSPHQDSTSLAARSKPDACCEVAAQVEQPGEHRQVLDELVGMEIVHAADRRATAPSARRRAQWQCRATAARACRRACRHRP